MECRDELVEWWQADEAIAVPLHAFLGMTPAEYRAWVESGAGCGCEACGRARGEDPLEAAPAAELRAEVRRLRGIIDGLAARVAAQAETLAALAERRQGEGHG